MHRRGSVRVEPEKIARIAPKKVSRSLGTIEAENAIPDARDRDRWKYLRHRGCDDVYECEVKAKVGRSLGRASRCRARLSAECTLSGDEKIVSLKRQNLPVYGASSPETHVIH